MSKVYLPLLIIIIFLILLSPLKSTAVLAGDANNDGKVDGLDYVIWLNHYNQSTQKGSSDGDFNSNGFVDGQDYVIWLNNYGQIIPTTTPTPIIPSATPFAPSPTILSPPAGLKAFPEAEGFGTQSVGGRGGKVIEVTNLNDSGTGSLRACIEASGPRNCVFRVAGTITLSSNLIINNPYITIAGQTAPGGGITLKSANSSSTVHLRVETHDVSIRYIRSRPGTNQTNGRALTVSSSSNPPYNVVIDHVSMSWSGDEMFITWYDTNNITVQWSIMAESLPAGDGGYKGPNLGDGGGSGYLSLHHNLLAHHNQRFPLTRTGIGPIDLVNNLMYNLGGYGYIHLREATKANLVNNYIKGGPNGTISTAVLDAITTGGYYHTGNLVEPGWSVKNFSPDNHRVSTRYNAPPITTVSTQQAYEDVLNKAGAVHGLNCDGTWFGRPDAVDARIIQSVRDGTRGHNIPPSQTDRGLGFISDPSEVGGWPTLSPGTACTDSDHDGMADTWEMNNFGNTSRGSPTNSSSDYDADGYTDLEEFLNRTNPNQKDT